MNKLYSRHLDKPDCNILAHALDYFVCNADLPEKTKRHAEAMLLEFDMACDGFPQQIGFKKLNDKVIKLNFGDST